MANWMMYWRFETMIDSIRRGGSLEHTASQQYRRIAVGDILWVIGLFDDGSLVLLGKQTVSRILNREQAKKKLGGREWPADFHAWSDKPQKKVFILIERDVAVTFRFEGKSKKLPEDFTGCHLQSMRKLTPETADLFELYWAHRRELDALPIVRKKILKFQQGKQP
jgi:hypothetical protein